MTILQEILEEGRVHIIDDFYPSLEWLDDYLKVAKFEYLDSVNYPGLTAVPPPNTAETQERLRQILGESTQFAHYDGQIRIVRKEDEGTEKTKIHIDPDRIVVLVYLSDPPEGYSPDDLGTFFFINKLLKRKKFASLGTIKNEMQNKLMAESNKDFTAWENWFRVAFKKNRALIFDGHLYHAPTSIFYGNDVYTGRLTQNFFPIRP